MQTPTPWRYGHSTDTQSAASLRRGPRSKATCDQRPGTPDSYARNYFANPFLFTYPGVVATEIEPWHEAGQTLRRLHLRFPSSIATHNPEQVFYFDSTGLQRRMDYITEVLGSTLVGHYSGNYRSFEGLLIATRRRIFRRNTVNLNQPSITLDIGNVEFNYANEEAHP
jgi:hypothetical protein